MSFFYNHAALLFSFSLLFKPLSHFICAGSGQSEERPTWTFLVLRSSDSAVILTNYRLQMHMNKRNDSLPECLYFFFRTSLHPALLIMYWLDSGSFSSPNSWFCRPESRNERQRTASPKMQPLDSSFYLLPTLAGASKDLEPGRFPPRFLLVQKSQ